MEREYRTSTWRIYRANDVFLYEKSCSAYCCCWRDVISLYVFVLFRLGTIKYTINEYTTREIRLFTNSVFVPIFLTLFFHFVNMNRTYKRNFNRVLFISFYIFGSRIYKSYYILWVQWSKTHLFDSIHATHKIQNRILDKHNRWKWNKIGIISIWNF